MRDGKRRVRSTALLLAMAMSGAAVGGAQAADSVGNPAIIDALNKLQASVNSLKTAVSGLQDQVNGLATSSDVKVRVTPPVILGTHDWPACEVVNATTSPLTVTVEMFNGVTTDAMTHIDNVTLPGGLRVILDGPPPDSPLDNETLYSAYCRFTVVSGGTRDAIRGTLAVRSTAKDRLSIPAE
jgi:hypothetical protein